MSRTDGVLVSVAACDDPGGGAWRIDVTRREPFRGIGALSSAERTHFDAMASVPAAQLRRAAHAFKREVAGARLGQAPDAVAFLNREGRPRLAPPHDATHVSLSHTAGAIAVAISEGPVGIDIEPIDGKKSDAARLAARYFAPDEGEAVAASSDPQFAFAWRWTAKEALLKAMGLSLSGALRTSMGGGERERESLPFTMQTRGAAITVFRPAATFVCAVARA